MLTQRAQGYDVLAATGHHVVYHRYTGLSTLTDDERERGQNPAKVFEKTAMRMIINFMPSLSAEEAVGRLSDESVSITAPVRIGEDDEIEWSGRRYRILARGAPSMITGFWTAKGKKI